MAKTELHEIFRSGNLISFIKTEYGALVSMLEAELDEGFDEFELWALQSCGIAEKVSSAGIRYGEDRGKFLTGDLVEKLNLIWKRVPGSSCYVGKFGQQGRRGQWEIIQELQGWKNLGIDL